MPYFYSESYGNLGKRQEIYDDHLKGWKYCCSDTPISGMVTHMPLTLDEYCKPVLGTKILDERNIDQMLQWYSKRKNQRTREREKPVDEMDKGVPKLARLLTVHQTWLWKINQLVVATINDKVEEPKHDFWVENRWTVTGATQLKKIGIWLSHLINLLDRPVLAGLPEPILNTFEKAIISLSDEVNKYVSLSNIDVNLVTEIRYYHDIGDIREELSMIKVVLLQQEEVWKAFISNAWPNYWKDGRFAPPLEDVKEPWRYIARPQVQFPKFKSRIAQLDEDARRVENSISIWLDLKAKHASLKQAHSAAVMSAAVFGFTIVTIIFTPLSFMLSLFALPIKRLQDHQVASRWSDDSGMYTTNYIGKWIGKSPSLSIATA